MSDEEHDIMVTQFEDVTGEPAERARFYLESSAWDLEVALGSFYESDALDVDDLEAARPEAAPEPPAPRPAAAEEESGGGSGSGGAASRPAPAGNINTFASRFGKSTRENDEDDSDSEEEGQAFYAGGSTTSGQQILGPTRKKEGSDFVKQMFKKARENGAEAVDPNTLAGHAHGGASGSRAFSGAGFKLGSTELSSEMIQGAAKKDEKPREFILKMWQNGFSIDDGPLRSYADEENKEFLRSVMTGRIPRELVAAAKGGEVMVNMEDHKDKQFEQPKVKAKPFQGSGFTLGNIAPDVASEDVEMGSPDPPSSPALTDAEAQQKLKVDSSKPLTTIQVRLSTGGRVIVKLNTTNTISDLRRYIRLVRPDAPVNFSLLTTFPNKELTDDTITLKDADVLGAAILMRAT